MTIKPCKCGSTPKFITCHDGPEILIQLLCSCGKHGAALKYTTQAGKLVAAQAAIDGWNLGN